MYNCLQNPSHNSYFDAKCFKSSHPSLMILTDLARRFTTFKLWISWSVLSWDVGACAASKRFFSIDLQRWRIRRCVSPSAERMVWGDTRGHMKCLGGAACEMSLIALNVVFVSCNTCLIFRHMWNMTPLVTPFLFHLRQSLQTKWKTDLKIREKAIVQKTQCIARDVFVGPNQVLSFRWSGLITCCPPWSSSDLTYRPSSPTASVRGCSQHGVEAAMLGGKGTRPPPTTAAMYSLTFYALLCMPPVPWHVNFLRDMQCLLGVHPLWQLHNPSCTLHSVQSFELSHVRAAPAGLEMAQLKRFRAWKWEQAAGREQSPGSISRLSHPRRFHEE